MLNEKLNKYNEIADSKGLLFFWDNIVNGASSVDGINRLRFHHIGKLLLNVDATILLFEEMSIIDINNGIVKLKISTDSIIHKEFISWFSTQYIQFLIVEKVISLSEIFYDSNIDKFVLGQGAIKMRHACYRNLLISMGIISKREGNGFYIENFLDSFIASNEPIIKKKNEDALLKELEIQREIGAAGELYVLSYETSRLSCRTDTNKIKRISIIDVSAGFDIISFNDEKSDSLDRFIEVKTYVGKPHFHWSSNEINTAKVRASHYFLYLIDYSRIDDREYSPIIIQDPVTFFKNNYSYWTFSADSYLVTQISNEQL